MGLHRDMRCPRVAQNVVEGEKSRINQLGLVAFLAFIFFTPEARQYVLAKWAELEEYIMEGLAYSPEYPVDAEYTVVRTIDLWNNDSGDGWLNESIPIPSDVMSKHSAVALGFNDGTEAPVSMIQEIMDIELRIDGEEIAIPLNGLPTKSKNNAVTTQEK